MTGGLAIIAAIKHNSGNNVNTFVVNSNEFVVSTMIANDKGPSAAEPTITVVTNPLIAPIEFLP